MQYAAQIAGIPAASGAPAARLVCYAALFAGLTLALIGLAVARLLALHRR
jgi:hypothetical protein